MDILFENNTKDQIREAADKNALILLPVGILEEHGPHLPVNTDNVIAYDLARQAAEQIKDTIPVMVLPCVWAGYHGKELENLPGSVRVKPKTLFYYVYDICESLVRNGFRKIVMVNGHGQNPAILQFVSRCIANDYGVNILVTYPMAMIGKEGRGIKTSPEGGAGGHACEVETSLVLALREELVDMTKVPEGDRCQHRTKFFSGDLFPEHEVVNFGYFSTWAAQGSRSGVLGEPKYASVEKGEAFIKAMMQNYKELLTEYYYLTEQEVTDQG